MPRTTLQISLPDEVTKAKLIALSKAEGHKTVSRLILKTFDDELNLLDGSEETKQSTSKTISTKVNEEERAAISEILSSESKTQSEWLLSLIRARLTKEPHFTKSELLDLNDAVYQIQAVGRNLNQLLKAIHSKQVVESPVNGKYALMLMEQIDHLKSRVTAYIEKARLRDVPND